MVLASTRPVKHPTTGIFLFRKRVPAALRPILGKSEEKVSLRTRDPSEVKAAHSRVSAEIEACWRQLAEGTQSLSHRQIESIAGAINREMVEGHCDNPDDPILKAEFRRDLAITRPAHRAGDAVLSQQFLEVLAGVAARQSARDLQKLSLSVALKPFWVTLSPNWPV